MPGGNADEQWVEAIKIGGEPQLAKNRQVLGEFLQTQKIPAKMFPLTVSVFL